MPMENYGGIFLPWPADIILLTFNGGLSVPRGRLRARNGGTVVGGPLVD